MLHTFTERDIMFRSHTKVSTTCFAKVAKAGDDPHREDGF